MKIWRGVLAHVRGQWMGALALFLVLTGGVAYAADKVFSSDIADNQVFSVDVRNDSLSGGGLTSADIRNDGSPGGGLTGADIRDQSGVDTCTHGTKRFGELCVRVLNDPEQHWLNAMGSCATLRLRLPLLVEAVQLSVASGGSLPNIGSQELFWTADHWYSGSSERSWGTSASGGALDSSTESDYRTVCVTTPTN
jgi:hypothetical protein